LASVGVGKSSGTKGRPALTAQATPSAGHRFGLGHVPVMLDEMLAALDVRAGGDYLDATFGAGGYTRAILEAGATRVFAIDRDPAAVARARQLAADWPALIVLEGRFGAMAELLAPHGVHRLDGIVLDLGVSSMQLGDPSRGFSFAADGRLDMRMSSRGASAAEVINRADAQTLAAILRQYGEEPAAGRIARAIVERRVKAPIQRTRELAELVAGVVGRRGGRIDPATRTFQALRIYVNDELGELERGLEAAEGLLGQGARLVVVAFHSLEDRMVKRFLSARSDALPRPSRHLPLPSAPPAAARWRLPSRRPLRPQPAEIARNPRARSARLRWAERAATVAPDA
jgi:16S rRNA (cytosine1402-N4)-methyltransferase